MRLRGVAGGLGGPRDLCAVLVGAGQKEDILAALTVMTREDVGHDRGIRMPDMRVCVHVVDRRGDVEAIVAHESNSLDARLGPRLAGALAEVARRLGAGGHEWVAAGSAARVLAGADGEPRDLDIEVAARGCGAGGSWPSAARSTSRDRERMDVTARPLRHRGHRG